MQWAKICPSQGVTGLGISQCDKIRKEKAFPSGMIWVLIIDLCGSS